MPLLWRPQIGWVTMPWYAELEVSPSRATTPSGMHYSMWPQKLDSLQSRRGEVSYLAPGEGLQTSSSAAGLEGEMPPWM